MGVRENIYRVNSHNFQTSRVLTKVLGFERITGLGIRWSPSTDALAGVQALVWVILGCDCMSLRGQLIDLFCLFRPV